MTGNFRLGLLAAAIFALTPAFSLAQEQTPPPPTVTVRTLQPQTVALTATLPGRVRPSAQAEVRPQVNGIITERLFEEGSQVQAGDILYRVDPATYEAAVAQARANVSQAEAQLRAAEGEAERVSTLSERGIRSTASQDDAVAARDVAAAALELATAQLEAAELELDRTAIRARLSGEIGFSQASAGALVTASQAEPMAVIRAIDPVYVDVTQSAAELLQWRRQRQDEDVSPPGEVQLVLADGSTFGQTGQLTAAEPNVDESTGVVSLRVEFANPDRLLLPGMYVQVEMPTGNVEGVFLAPQESVARDQRGNPTALVVNADNEVEQRALTIIRDRDSDWIVSDGLQAGDRIIVAGGQNVAPGAKVNPEEEAEPDARAAPQAAAEDQTGDGDKPASDQENEG